jgi:hypothetical protein
MSNFSLSSLPPSLPPFLPSFLPSSVSPSLSHVGSNPGPHTCHTSTLYQRATFSSQTFLHEFILLLLENV